MKALRPARPGTPADDHSDDRSPRRGRRPGARDDSGGGLVDKFEDEDYPAYSMGRAAEMLDVTPAFLRNLDAAKLFVPQRSSGGHRRYSRYQLRLAQRARDMVDQGTALEAACRIIILEDQLAEAQRIHARLQRDRPRNPAQDPPQ
ncbi:hypothetical protein GCM10010182_31920 [Actinomadura cremea]|nr:hypothetical protein GCM10010182_31920 [Actinomadura cremea]